MTAKTSAPSSEREPAAVEDLEQRAAKNATSINDEEAGGEQAQPQRIAPAVADHEEGEEGGDQHRAHDRHAVGRGEAGGRAEADRPRRRPRRAGSS